MGLRKFMTTSHPVPAPWFCNTSAQDLLFQEVETHVPAVAKLGLQTWLGSMDGTHICLWMTKGNNSAEQISRTQCFNSILPLRQSLTQVLIMVGKQKPQPLVLFRGHPGGLTVSNEFNKCIKQHAFL
ncbi:hypothetical protein ONE63_011347 [Megalurothrips usitatus]|uniref:Uncharacterized protein n=1 Tax=Megalurothrips usitatus TaxID=439358 RepID=A0AAV7X3P1_9NEOP|nr:hypothetical protein ONE63_011347 [Megalurothrips usitatus]